MSTLESIRRAEKELDRRFEGKLVINRDLDRTLVRFQANKKQTCSRWFKYKEGFSAALVRYLLDKLGIDSGRLLDPFAGSGATLSLPSGVWMLSASSCSLWAARSSKPARCAASADDPVMVDVLDHWLEEKPWRKERIGPFRPPSYHSRSLLAIDGPPRVNIHP